MRTLVLAVFAAALLVSAPGFADLQNVSASGSIRIRGDYANVGNMDFSIVEQRTRLGLRADFTDSVNAFIEFDDYHLWGDGFRSNWATGADFRGAGDAVDLYQAYIEADQMWGTPLSLRVGRQELSFGSQWLVGVNDANPFFTGISFDAARLTYAGDSFTVDAWWSKLAETFGDFSDDDTDFYGIYASCTALEGIVFDAYWLYVRDEGVLSTAVLGAVDSDLHTLGLRLAGKRGAFDFEGEVAYQFGEADVREGFAARLLGIELDRDYDEWGANLELGYTFDAKTMPRLYAGGAFLGGGGGNDLAFNRLFSNHEYTPVLDDSDLSNVWLLRAGGMCHPTEALTLIGEGIYLQQDEEAFRQSSDLGWIAAFVANYRYTSDLSFELGYFHIFTDDAVRGSFIRGNGLGLWSTPEDDYDYLYLESKISF